MNRRIYFFKDYLIEKFGHPLYRIPINLGLGCPHKTKDSSGCIFCAEDGARAMHLQRNLKINEQIEEGIKYVHRRYDPSAAEYMAYLQAYTNTYTDIEKLKELYEKILISANFRLLIVATRPDCLPKEVLKYFYELNKRVELWVELGIQTANDITLKTINRGHDFKTAEQSIKALNELGIKTATHIIIGLPGETLNDYVDTIKKVTALPLSGIKLHNLLILKDSELGDLYSKCSRFEHNTILIDEIGKIPLFNEYEYIDVLTTIIRLIPSHIPVLRLTADAPENKILSPKWNLTKGRILELLQSVMEENNYVQGDLANKQLDKHNLTNLTKSQLKVKTKDGSFTFYNQVYKECYHSQAGANSEAYYKFILPSEIPSRLKDKPLLNILDVGFGLGYNAIAALKEVITCNGSAKITSLEIDTKSLYLALSIYETNPFEHKILTSLINNKFWSDGKNSVELITGDARKSVTLLQEKFDLIFLDAFSTNRNSELWTYDFIKALKKLLMEDGAIITYSAAFPVRGAMFRNKLHVGTTEPFGRKNGGTIASRDAKKIKMQLQEKDRNIILKSTAGTPYRDPTLSSTNKEIIKWHDKIIKKLRAKGIPKWFPSPHTNRLQK
jgi:radical SAM protein (TIGR01212 family)